MNNMEKKLLETQFALCIENNDGQDLKKRKFYQVLPDEVAAREGYMQVMVNPRKTIYIPNFIPSYEA